MGYYLNSTSPAAAYKKTVDTTYFVDKSGLIGELFSVMGTDDGNICLTRPRRFGKTAAANMIAAFFGKGCDTSELFDRLAIAANPNYRKYLNQTVSYWEIRLQGSGTQSPESDKEMDFYVHNYLFLYWINEIDP